VADALGAAGLAPWPATLLVSELATNAVDHARTQFEVRLAVGRRVGVEVSDACPDPPVPRSVDMDSEHGRGLQVLDSIAAAWGVKTGRSGKTVWFELDPSPST
jgi:two-component sensor histidine kinase